MSFDRRTVRTRDGRVIGVIPTPTGPDWDGNFGMPRYEECILCGRDTSGEAAVLGVCFPDPIDPDRTGGAQQLNTSAAGHPAGTLAPLGVLFPPPRWCLHTAATTARFRPT